MQDLFLHQTHYPEIFAKKHYYVRQRDTHTEKCHVTNVKADIIRVGSVPMGAL